MTTSLPRPAVVDASAFVELLLQTRRAPAARHALEGAAIVCVDLVHAEVLSALRGLERGGQIDGERARAAAVALARAPVRHLPMQPLIPAAWALRERVSVYDAFHVALAQELSCPLVTGDLRLARAGLEVAVVAV
ncbi:MAG TPA: type II toxin-antitoxin system VapC family toxin [Gaiellaceae bacterium]|nr:type II toxin-antitoxin system VapC family toxin [Gaiellaceae bacterium]